MIEVRNLDFKKIITIDLWLLKNDKKKNLKISFLIIYFLKIVYRSILFIPKIKSKKKFNIFYIRTFARPDLNKHSNYYENIRDSSVCILSEKKKKIDILILLKIFVFLIINFKFWFLGLKKCNLNFFSKNGFYIFLIFLESLSNVLKIIPFLKKHKRLVCFQEVLPTENFLCQYANKLNIQTYSLQHAIGIYSSKGSFDVRFPICNYMNLVSKNILCWGNCSKTIFTKHTNSRIHIIGKAYLPNLSTKINGVTFIFENKEFKKINNHMLRLSDKFQKNKIQISRWYKPSHSLSSSGIIRDGQLTNIIIGCNSSLLIELGFLGFKVFVTKYSNLKKYLPKDLAVDDNDFFTKKKIILNNYPHKIWKNFIECTNNESVKRYKKILI